MFSQSPIDWALVLAYFGFLAAVWLRLLKARPAALEYLVAGRRITLPALVATLVATWYGGILGVGEYSYRYGISNWLVFGAPYYIGALLFAWLFARRAREAALYTIPDLLERRYGRGPALLGAVAVFLTSAPAAYVLMLGTLFAAMFGLPLVPCVIAAALLSIFYIDRGGLRTVVFTRPGAVRAHVRGLHRDAGVPGGPPWRAALSRALAPRHAFHVARRQSAAGHPRLVLHRALDAGRPRLLAARLRGARSRVARRAVLWSVAFWILFDFLTTTTGLYARALLPELPNPVFAFPELAGVTLPPGALGLFYLGDDRHGDEHDRLVRLHRRHHGRPRLDLAPAPRGDRGAHAGVHADRLVGGRAFATVLALGSRA